MTHRKPLARLLLAATLFTALLPMNAQQLPAHSLSEAIPLGRSPALQAEGWVATALAVGDLNHDGIPDFATGWRQDSRARIEICLTTTRLLSPGRDLRDAASFSTQLCATTRGFDLDEPLDFLFIGDFGGDGQRGLAWARRGGRQLFWQPQPLLARAPQLVEIGVAGEITAMTAGEVNRADRLEDLVLGVQNGGQGAFLIYQGSAGALRSTPERIPTAQPPSQLLLGNFLSGPGNDVAALTADGVEWLVGHDATHGLGERGSTLARRTDWLALDEPQNLTLRKPLEGSSGRLELVVQQADGPVHFLSGSSASAPFWHEDSPAGTPSSGVAGTTLRLNADAIDDLVRLDPQLGPVLHLSQRAAVFVVNSTLDLADSIPGDGICDTANNPPDTPPSGICTLRAAIEQANASPGADQIRFNVGGGGVQQIDGPGGGALFDITEAVTIDGATQPGYAGTPLIEVDFSGGGAIPGFAINADNVLIRSLSVTNFTLECISIFGNDNAVWSSYLGLEPGGGVDGCFRGIGISGDDNDILGSVISGHIAGGVALAATAERNLLEESNVGLNLAGDAALGNGNLAVGVDIDGPANGVIDSVVSGHDGVGIWIGPNADGNTVAGTFVGTSSDGQNALGNKFAGILVDRSNDSVLGTGGLFGGNVVAATAPDFFGGGGLGIFIRGSARTTLHGNRVGTNAQGNAPLPNTWHGVGIFAYETTASTETTLLQNLVSSNGTGASGGHGVLVDGSSDTVLAGNLIGVPVGSFTDFGNNDDGIHVVESDLTAIGPLFLVAPGNTIAFNGGAGVVIVDRNGGAASQNTRRNTVAFNQILRNGGLAIDLARGGEFGDGVTANDVGDGDFGANDFQNYPTVTGVVDNGNGTWTVQTSLASTASADFGVHVYANEQCDPSGNGEAAVPLGAGMLTTNGGGIGTASIIVDIPPTLVTATATDVDGNTSELSPCFMPPGGILGNRVFLDSNGDGLQGPEELGVDGITVRLLSSANAVLDSKVTAGGGYFGFADVPSGSYRLEVSPPVGWNLTLRDVGGDDTIDSDVDPTTGRSDLFSYVFGTLDLSRDAGFTSLIFSDGFESGDTSAWSAASP